MTVVVWKGEQRTIDDLASAVEQLCAPGEPILSPAPGESEPDSDQQGGAQS